MRFANRRGFGTRFPPGFMRMPILASRAFDQPGELHAPGHAASEF